MSSELVAVELQLKGYEGVMSDMRALDQMLNGFRGKKNKIEIQADLANAKKELLALKGALTEFQEQQAQVSKGGTAWNILQGYIEDTNAKMKDCRQRANELQYALKNFSGKSFKQAFDWISSKMAHLGSAMQSAGNALTRLTTPFARFTSGMVMGAGYKALNKFTEGLENGFNRYDTMKKYPKIMAAFGYSNEESQKSIEALDKSVRGLPTGLDEMVDMSQRFTATTGSIEKGTKLAIAANNAFLASMSTDTQKYQGMMQLQDVLGGKDMNAREWNSLVSSMTPAIVKMGESLGYTKDNMDEFIQTVRDGDMSNKDFIDQLIKIGNEGGVLEKMAQESKNTWQAFFANVGNAASRMTAGVIQAFDEISQSVTGKDVNQLLADTVIPGIDNMTASVKEWIKAHPEEITDFFKSLGSINWKSIGRGVAEGIQWVAGLVKQFADIFGGKDLSRIGRWMIKGNIFGNALTILGGLIKGSRGIIATIGATGFKGVQTIKNIKKFGGIAGWLGTLAVGDNAKKTEETIETVAKSSGKMGKFSTGLSKLFTGWSQIATMVGGTAFVGFVSFKAFKSMFKDLKEIVALTKSIDWGTASLDLIAMGGFISAFIGFGTKIGNALGLAGLKGGAIFSGLTLMFAGSFWADMALIKRGFKAISDTTGYLNSAIDNLNNVKSIDNVGGAKTKVKNAITAFNQVIDLFQEDTIGKGRNDPVNGDGKQNRLKKLSADVVKTIDGLDKSLGTMVSAIKEMNELSKIRVNIGGLTAVIPKFRVGLMKIGNLIAELPSIMGDDGTAENVTNMATTVTQLKTALSAMIGSDGILAILPEIANRMQKLQHSGEIDTLNQQMDVLGRGLQQMMNSLSFGGNDTATMLSDMTNISSAIDQIKAIMKKLKGIGKVEVDTKGTDNIKTIIQNIKSAFDEGQANELSGQIIAMVASVEAALALFDNLNTDIQINPKVKLGSGFQSSVNSAAGKIRSANGDIQSAVDSIQTSYTKRVQVRILVNTIVSRMGDIGGVIAGNAQQAAENTANALNHSIGGRISRNGALYRAFGGSVFKPRGTDRIPAMLTEGEYVHKKQAVDFFGVDFMRKVNNMDVRGAMESLLTRAGTSVGIGRQSVVNNTVNNNQRITQNINTNNPNFAKARMGRYVGAL